MSIYTRARACRRPSKRTTLTRQSSRHATRFACSLAMRDQPEHHRSFHHGYRPVEVLSGARVHLFSNVASNVKNYPPYHASPEATRPRWQAHHRNDVL